MAETPRNPGGAVSGKLNIATNLAVTAGVILWVTVTHFRVVFAGEGGLPPPAYWFTAAIAPTLAAAAMVVRLILMTNAATSASKDREETGFGDMSASFLAAFTVLVLDILMLTGNVKSGPNLWIGMTVFTLTTPTVAWVSWRVWWIANRRPGGTIGGN